MKHCFPSSLKQLHIERQKKRIALSKLYEWLPILKALKEINFDPVALYEPSVILPDMQAEDLKRIKAGFERMAQEFAAV
ncbi:MAG: hypothetical protein OXI30_01120 [Chloroflexota bacterium]|nr:hypothetical protein [Chloroflexota bacterium]